jgi:hypothetical protein
MPQHEQSRPAIYPKYRAYLLRLWQETPGARWRASVQETTGGERRAFPDLEALFAYLCQVAAEDPPPSVDPQTPEKRGETTRW